MPYCFSFALFSLGIDWHTLFPAMPVGTFPKTIFFTKPKVNLGRVNIAFQLVHSMNAILPSPLHLTKQ